MESEYGKQMMNAMRAVIDMHEDCIRLFRDLDKELAEYRSVYGNAVALDLGQTINRRRYLAEGLVRCYDTKEQPHQVLGINICLFNPDDVAFTEPVLVVSNITYMTVDITPAERQLRAWDPWEAFFKWIPKRVYSEAIVLDSPAKRSSIDSMTLAAKPLAEITNLQSALDLISLTGRP